MQLFSPQVQSPWRTQALMVLDGCHLSITVLSTLGTQGAQESCHQHGSVWTSLEHGLRTGRGGRSTDTRVREGGPEPTCWGRPGTDVGVSRDGRRGSPGEAGQRAQKMGTQRRRARVAPSHQSSRHPILFQKSNVRSVHGHRLARRCVHPCAGPQRPVVGKAAPCPPQGRAETLPAPEQSRDAVPPRAEQRRCPPPPESRAEMLPAPAEKRVFLTHVPGALALWVPVSLCRGWTTGHPGSTLQDSWVVSLHLGSRAMEQSCGGPPRPKAVARVPASLPIRPPREEGTAGVPCGSGRQGRASRWPRTAHPISLAPASP